MFDGVEHLHQNTPLLTLLTHYANLGEANRETWQDRLMTIEQLNLLSW